MKITTIVIGSYPYARMEPEDAIGRAVEEQITAGIDVISDGQVRADMVAIFAKGIPGYQLQGRKANVISKIIPPTKAISLGDLSIATDIASGRAKVKGIITGPTTMAHCSILNEVCPYKPHETREGSQSMTVDPELVLDIARAMAREAEFLTEAGYNVIQIDEPFFSLPDVDVDIGLEAIGMVADKIDFSAIHVCGDIRPIMTKLLDSKVNLVEVEGGYLVQLDWLTPALLEEKNKKICWSVISVDTNDVESVEEISQRINACVDRLGTENIWVSPDCGMRARKPESAKGKLNNMVKAVRKIETTFNQ